MYKSIDMRLRPPYKSLAQSSIFSGYMSAGKQCFRQQMGWAESAAAREGSTELLIKEMDDWGVEKGVVMTRISDGNLNSDLLSIIEDYPGRFIPVPHVEPANMEESLNIIDEYIINGPCKALYLEPGFRKEIIIMHASDERIYPIYEKCQEAGIPIILQYGGGKNSTEYFTPTDIFQIAEDFKHLKICISHGGWPQVQLHLQQAYAHDNVYISPDYFFQGFPGSDDYLVAANGILQDKVLFGSAFPLLSVESAVKMYIRSPLKEEVLPKVLYENAVRFLNL